MADGANARGAARVARLAVFASGRGTNLGALLRAFPPVGDAEAETVLVISDRPDAGALEVAREAGVRALHLPFGRDREAFEAAANAALRASRVDLVALAGFMRVLSPAFAETWRGRLLNIHPSLLPAFPGLHAVRQALAAGASTSGCTVHFVDAGIDTGPVILQREVPVHPDDDEASLQARIQVEEHLAYPAAVRAVLRGEALVDGAPGIAR